MSMAFARFKYAVLAQSRFQTLFAVQICFPPRIEARHEASTQPLLRNHSCNSPGRSSNISVPIADNEQQCTKLCNEVHMLKKFLHQRLNFGHFKVKFRDKVSRKRLNGNFCAVLAVEITLPAMASTCAVSSGRTSRGPVYANPLPQPILARISRHCRRVRFHSETCAQI